MTKSKYWKVDIDSDTVLMRCCDEIQFEYYCTTCGEKGGCYYCDFNPDEPCECVEESNSKSFGFYVEEQSMICPDCANNPLYKGILEEADQEGYPDGYTCNDCNATIGAENYTGGEGN